MARVGGEFEICPALTESMIPGAARRVVTLGFAALAVPFIHASMPPGEPTWWMFAVVAAREAVIGFFIGFFAAIPFWVAENVGNFIDNQRGATMGEVYSPLNGSQVSTTGYSWQFALLAVFVEGLSFAPDAPVQVLGALDGMLKTTVVISAPVIIVMFLATLGLGLVNRTAPQLNVFFLSMPVKSALGVAMLIVYLPFIMDMLMYTNEGEVLGPVRRLLGG